MSTVWTTWCNFNVRSLIRDACKAPPPWGINYPGSNGNIDIMLLTLPHFCGVKQSFT